YLHRQFLPQPSRYRLEMELSLALIVVFGLRAWFERWPVSVKRTFVLLLIAVAGEQIVDHHRYAKNLALARDATKSVEYRVSKWTDENLAGVRVMFPGSIAQWANYFAPIQQFTGSSWSLPVNEPLRRGLAAAYYGGETVESDARKSLAWLKAYGVGAI